ncbi:MAG: agmatine deiminase family protein [Bacteroidaceae bacterium]|nr:agmatine deiminase family protein [Bacteroidaceae bacterium]
MKTILPAEWEEQQCVQLTLPNAETDWAPYLDEVIDCYESIAAEINQREGLVVFKGPINDTWARDHAFISTRNADGTITLNDFCFNGWGLKFAANLDNQINRNLLQSLGYNNADYADRLNIVLEGGSIESDGKGTILTTEDCLLAPNRNNYHSRGEAEQMLRDCLGAERVLWLKDVGLTGDDTDSHIDTLARFCPDDTIAYVYEDTDKSPQSWGLKSMEEQLMAFRTAEGRPYRLLRLPMPSPVVYEGETLPATYANFLVINGAVLVPTYGQPETDREAMDVIQQAFPDREIIGIDCRVLVRQHGSLHCITMQYPAPLNK